MNPGLIERIVGHLADHAVIGAFALAARGYVRQTNDFDLLTTDRGALQDRTWDDLRDEHTTANVRRGDFDDPLAGVVAIRAGDSAVDVVVAKYRWQKAVIDRGELLDVGGITLRVPRTADLILLKLFAGGYGDLHDISALLEIGPYEWLVSEVDAALNGLPDEMRSAWRRLLTERQRH